MSKLLYVIAATRSADNNKDDLECRIRLKVRLRDRMNMGLKCRRQKCGQWTVGSDQKKFVRIRGSLRWSRRRAGVEPLKLVIFHLMQRHFADNNALNGFLMTQRQMILKDVWVYNVRKLHRPRTHVRRFLSWYYRYDLTIVYLYNICDSAVFCALHDQLASLATCAADALFAFC